MTWNDSLPRSPRLERKPPRTVQRASQRSTNSKYYYQGGSSTYRQTVCSFTVLVQVHIKCSRQLCLQLFNSIAILLGIGMLSEPLAFAYAGWVPGTLLIIFYGFITCYTFVILNFLPSVTFDTCFGQRENSCPYHSRRSKSANLCRYWL